MHHTGSCKATCGNYRRTGHMTKDCRATGANTQPIAVRFHGCGEFGHYKTHCPKNTNNVAHGRAYVLGDGNITQNPDVVTGTFLLNQRSAKILFDSGADKSFVSTSFASILNITPIELDTTYEIEIENGNLLSTNTLIKNCTLTLQNKSFPIDLMPIQLGTFDVIIGMDWLSKHRARIICNEKVVQISLNGEIFIIQCDKHKTPFNIISYTNTVK